MVSYSIPFAFPSLCTILSRQRELKHILSPCPHCGECGRPPVGRREWAPLSACDSDELPTACACDCFSSVFLKASRHRRTCSWSKRRPQHGSLGARTVHNFLGVDSSSFPWWCSTPLNHPIPQAKKGLHPLLYRITVVGTKGGTFPIFSAVQQKGSKLFLQADQDTHSLWSGKKVVSAATGQVAKFKKRFDFLSGTTIGKKK